MYVSFLMNHDVDRRNSCTINQCGQYNQLHALLFTSR